VHFALVIKEKCKPFELCAAKHIYICILFLKVKIIKSNKCYIKFKMFCIKLTLKVRKFYNYFMGKYRARTTCICFSMFIFISISIQRK